MTISPAVQTGDRYVGSQAYWSRFHLKPTMTSILSLYTWSNKRPDCTAPVVTTSRVLLTPRSLGCTRRVLVRSLPGSPQSSLEYLNPKYNHSTLSPSISIFLLSLQFQLHFLSLYRLHSFFSSSQKTIIYLTLPFPPAP